MDFKDQKIAADRGVSSFDQKRHSIEQQSLAMEKAELFDFSTYLITEIKIYGWCTAGKRRAVNHFSDVCLAKLVLAQNGLQSLEALDQADYVAAEIKALKHQKLFQKYASHVFVGVILLGGLLLYHLAFPK